jgi:hypothetical protein
LVTNANMYGVKLLRHKKIWATRQFRPQLSYPSLGIKGFSLVCSLIRRISSPWKVVFGWKIRFETHEVAILGMRE